MISIYILSHIAITVLSLAVGYYLGAISMFRFIVCRIPDAVPYIVRYHEEKEKKKEATKDFDSEVNR